MVSCSRCSWSRTDFDVYFQVFARLNEPQITLQRPANRCSEAFLMRRRPLRVEEAAAIFTIRLDSSTTPHFVGCLRQEIGCTVRIFHVNGE